MQDQIPKQHLATHCGTNLLSCTVEQLTDKARWHATHCKSCTMRQLWTSQLGPLYSGSITDERTAGSRKLSPSSAMTHKPCQPSTLHHADSYTDPVTSVSILASSICFLFRLMRHTNKQCCRFLDYDCDLENHLLSSCCPAHHLSPQV